MLYASLNGWFLRVISETPGFKNDPELINDKRYQSRTGHPNRIMEIKGRKGL